MIVTQAKEISMELIEIGKTKLIFLLEQKDMEKYKINTREYSPSMKKGFLRLLSDAGAGDAFLSDVLVEIFETKDGGCEMFVTKISDQTESANLKDGFQKYIYSFSELCDLTAACKMLFDLNVSGGAAYADRDRHVFYLTLDREHKYLSEFNAKRCKGLAKEYLFEHCRLFCSDAVKKLSLLS